MFALIRCNNASIKKHVHLILMISFLTCACGIFGCATRQPEPDAQFEMAYLEKQLSEMDKKLEDIYHRVSVIQFMVDNHERLIRDREGMNTGRSATPLPYPSQAMPPASPVAPVPVPTPVPVVKAPPPAKKSGSQVLYASPDTKKQPPPAQVSRQTQTNTRRFSDAQQPYKLGRNAYNGSRFDEAIRYFDQVVRDFPGHDLADNALYWKGECLYAQKKYDAAIDSFRRVATEYPDGGKAPDALLKTGYAYLSLGDKDNAKLFLKKVARTFPFTQAGTKAQAKLKEMI